MTQGQTLIDFRDYPVFSATTYPCILIARNTLPPKSPQLHQMSVAPTVQLDQIDTWARTAALFPQQQPGKEGWSFESDVLAGILAKVKAAGVPLETYVGGKIYYGINTGLNEAFVINAATRERLIAEDPASAEIIKPFLRGRDIKRYQVAPKEQSFLRLLGKSLEHPATHRPVDHHLTTRR